MSANGIHRILFINNTDPEQGGGGERALLNQAVCLQERGFETVILSSRTDPDLPRRRTICDVEIRTVKCLPDVLHRFEIFYFYFVRAMFPFFSLPFLVRTLYRQKIDVVVDSHTPHPSLVPFIGPIFSIPIIAHVHEYHDRSALRKYPLPIGIIQLTVQNFLRMGLYTAIVVPREYTKNALVNYGVTIPIYVVPNGIDVEVFENPPELSVETFDLLVISRLEYRKGVDLLIDVMNRVVQNHPTVQLGIAGSGTQRDNLEAMVDRLDLESNVKFLGYVSEERKRALLHNASIFVLPSRQEGFGIAALEAMASGTPIVANKLPVIEDILPKGPNRLVDAENTEVFADTLIEVIDQIGNTQMNMEINQERAHNYDLDRVTQQSISVLTEVYSTS